MADPVVRSEQEIQRAHDLLGIAATYHILDIREHNLSCYYGEALCWVLGHDHPEPNDFEVFMTDLEKVLDGLGLAKLAGEESHHGGVS